MVRGFAARVKPPRVPFAREGPGKEPSNRVDAQSALTDSWLSSFRFHTSRIDTGATSRCHGITQRDLSTGCLPQPPPNILTRFVSFPGKLEDSLCRNRTANWLERCRALTRKMCKNSANCAKLCTCFYPYTCQPYYFHILKFGDSIAIYMNVR
jgi:hypothetical protein